MKMKIQLINEQKYVVFLSYQVQQYVRIKNGNKMRLLNKEIS
jgi:hypothetical protein